MTTLCASEYIGPDRQLAAASARQLTDLERAEAGRAAFRLAIRTGYCITVARALKRQAWRKARVGKTPEETAEEVVPMPGDSATFDPGPRAA